MSGISPSAPAAPHSRILGIGAYRPRRVVPNSEIVEAIDSSDEWIQERSGIKQRHWAGDGESLLEMSEYAADDAIAMAGIDKGQIDAVLVATVTHWYNTPAAAPMLAARMGLTDPVAFDISAACAGYCHAIGVAHDMIRGGSASHILVVGVERLSDFTKSTDRGTAFIFGDGAGAAVVGPSEAPGIGPTIWGSDGAQWEVIKQNESWMDLVQQGGEPHLTMQGQSVFRWAVWGMAPVAQKAMDAAGVSADDLDAFVPHQANIRIISSMAKQLKLPAHVPIATDVCESANTSAASVPLAMERMIREGTIKRGGLALQLGFGAGLSYAAQVVQIP